MLGFLKRAAFGAVIAGVGAGLAATAGLAQSKTITIGEFGGSKTMQLVAASDKLAKETGWTIEWRKFQAGTDVIAAMASGDIKLSELGSSPLAIAATSGVDLKMFMVTDGIGSAESLIARNGSGIKSIADLKGKKVAVPLGSTSHFSLMGALENAKVPASDVTVLGMSPDQINAAWAQGLVDAAWIWDPVQSTILKTGTRIMGADEVTGKPTFDAWVVNGDFAKKNKKFMVAFVKAMAAANAEYNKDPKAFTADSAPVKTIAKAVGAKPEDVVTIMGGYSFPSIKQQLSDKWMGGDNMAKLLKTTAVFLKDQKKIPTVLPDYSKFVDTDFLKAAEK